MATVTFFTTDGSQVGTPITSTSFNPGAASYLGPDKFVLSANTGLVIVTLDATSAVGTKSINTTHGSVAVCVQRDLREGSKPTHVGNFAYTLTEYVV